MQKILSYENGLKASIDTIASLKSVSVGFWVGVGSAKEAPEINGLSHFVEHMIFKGTDKLSAYDIANKFESYGASVNAFTSKGATCYYFKCIDEYLDECFSLLSEILFSSVFDSVELDKERQVIIEEINMVEDEPSDICYDLLAKALYGESSLGQTILGPIENVKRFDKKAVLGFVKEFYAAPNMVISMAGAIDETHADMLIKRHILPFVGENKSKLTEPKKISITPTRLERIKDFEQSNIAFAYPTVPFDHPLSTAQSVLNLILGGTMSSRLFQQIRENLSLAYSVYSTPSAQLYNGSLTIVLNVSPENTKKAIDAALKEIEKMSTITPEELKRAKIGIKSSLLFSRENVQTVMMNNGKMLLYKNKKYDIVARAAAIEKVTISDISCFCKKFLSAEPCLAYVGKSIF